MNLLDLLILALVVGAAVGSYRLGFVTRAVSWLFLGAGLFVALRLLPPVLEQFDEASSLQLLALTLLILLAGALVGQAIGVALGHWARLAIPAGGARRVDQVAGAVVGAFAVVLLVWMVLPVMAGTPGWPSREARESLIAQVLDVTLPEPPDTVRAVQRLIGEEQFPLVFDALRPTPELGPPPAESGLSDAVAQDVAASTVRIAGVACDRELNGSGFVVAPDTVVTNAHVVAGEEETEVVRTDGAELPATVVAFDPDRDLAILAVAGLGLDALPLGDPDEGTVGGVFGYPGGGPLRIAPFEVAREVEARGRDIYNASVTVRQVLELSAALRPGDSGAALVDPGGSVVGVAFAVAPDRPDVSYALTTDELEAVLTSATLAPVSTGACIG